MDISAIEIQLISARHHLNHLRSLGKKIKFLLLQSTKESQRELSKGYSIEFFVNENRSVVLWFDCHVW